MPAVQRVFSIPEAVSSSLDACIPKQERSKFVTRTLARALQDQSRATLVDVLDNLEPWEVASDKSVVDVLREIRSGEANKLTGNA